MSTPEFLPVFYLSLFSLFFFCFPFFPFVLSLFFRLFDIFSSKFPLHSQFLSSFPPLSFFVSFFSSSSFNYINSFYLMALSPCVFWSFLSLSFVTLFLLYFLLTLTMYSFYLMLFLFYFLSCLLSFHFFLSSITLFPTFSSSFWNFSVFSTFKIPLSTDEKTDYRCLQQLKNEGYEVTLESLLEGSKLYYVASSNISLYTTIIFWASRLFICSPWLVSLFSISNQYCAV